MIATTSHARADASRAGAAARLPIQEATEALMAGDVERARRLARRVLAQTGSRTAVMADLLHPAQVEVGNLWYLGLATSADELRATAVVDAVVDRLPPTPTENPVARGSRCILATPFGDPHRLGLKILAAALEDGGWTVSALDSGARWVDVIRRATEEHARLVAISAGIPPAVAPLAQAIDRLHEHCVRVIVGGVAFDRQPELWRRVGADAAGSDVRIGTVLARRLATR